MSETVTQVNETTQQIVRSRTCGLKDFYIALVQSNTATAYTAGTPVKLARAIKAKIDEKWTSEFQSSLPRGERQQFSPKSSLFSQQKLSKIFNLNNKLF